MQSKKVLERNSYEMFVSARLERPRVCGADLGVRKGSAEGAVTPGSLAEGSWLWALPWGRSSWTQARPAAEASCANVSN